MPPAINKPEGRHIMTTQIRPTRTVLALALAIAAAASAPSALAANTNVSAAGKIVTPINITAGNNLSFGDFANGAGTVVLSTSGSRTVTGSPALIGTASSVATFTITGDTGLGFTIDYSGTSTSLSNGTDTIAFTPASDLSAAGATATTVGTGTLTGGTQTLYVGGTLTLVGGEAAGDYTGTVSATVEYQ
jgi:hypothetical protein